jgi:hypothetical protein
MFGYYEKSPELAIKMAGNVIGFEFQNLHGETYP